MPNLIAGETPGTNIDTETGLEIRPLEKEHDAKAAMILTAATFEGTEESGQRALDDPRTGGNDRALGAWLNDELVGVYTLKRDGMANEIAHIAVHANHRGSGYGRVLLHDALRRSGRRPVVAETDDDALGFYKSCGFKLVGRRNHKDYGVRYRLGWHAPSTRPAGGGTDAAMKRIGATRNPSE